MVKVAAPNHVQFAQKLTAVPVGWSLGTADELFDELQHYCNELLGREDAPVQSPYLDLCEVATAYYARAQEIDMLIHEGERHGDILKGSDLYRFRTGALRSFIEMTKRQAELGSRRLTQEQMLADARRDRSL